MVLMDPPTIGNPYNIHGLTAPRENKDLEVPNHSLKFCSFGNAISNFNKNVDPNDRMPHWISFSSVFGWEIELFIKMNIRKNGLFAVSIKKYLGLTPGLEVM